MSDLPAINIESEFLKSLDAHPVDIAHRIENQLEEFVLAEITPQHPNVYVLERKGFNLFRPYFDPSRNVSGLNSIKLLYNSKTIRINCYSENDPEKENVLVTDAIGEGKEVDITLSTLNEFRPEIKISKVYAYLAKQDGLNKLVENFPLIQFNSLKLVTSSEDYREEHKRLFCVYHSRMEPIDGEHPYKIYDIKSVESDIIHDVQSAIPSIYPGEFDIKEDKLLINSKKAFSVNILEPDLILNRFSWYDPEVYEVDRMQFRFKYDPENFKLRVMALSLINYNPNLLSKWPHLIFGNCFKKLDVKFCQTSIGCSTRSSQFIVTCCPHCIDWNISQYLLSQFESILTTNPVFSVDMQ
ncbi:hypothetical protein [Methanoculleus sp.]|uniref:hypothetical protein n=1 Tax=Methanoculleus sp. TaxID=90427 RepID=UPI0025D25D68|nr:hypothetical protein [Methanoculleus sp.]